MFGLRIVEPYGPPTSKFHASDTQPKKPTDGPRCTICDGPNGRPCVVCASTAYCSPICQETDEPVHKVLCETFKRMPPRPTSSHTLSIFFPVNEENPKLIWINILVTSAATSTEHGSVDFNSLLGSDLVLGITYRPANLFRHFALDCTLAVFHRDAFVFDGSKDNQSIRSLTGGLMYREWKGPIAVMRLRGRDPKQYSDVTLGDLRHAVDYFGNGHPSLCDPNMTLRSGRSTQGIRVACVGDRKMGIGPLTMVAVPRDHKMFKEPVHIPISNHLHLPLFVYKMRPSKKWEDVNDSDGRSPNSNESTSSLLVDINKSSATWGLVPTGWKSHEIGSVVFVRKDGRKLQPQHIEAMMQYCDTWKPEFAKTRGEE